MRMPAILLCRMMAGVDHVEDFLRQMMLTAFECSPLCEIPLGSYWLGSPIVHGPWPAASCAAILKVWYEAELLRLHFPDSLVEWNLIPGDWDTRLVDGDALADPDAKELLDHPERWVRERADGYVVPCATWQGDVAPMEEWLAKALDTAQRQPLTAPDLES